MKIKTSDELEFAVFCIENVAAKLVRDGVSDITLYERCMPGRGGTGYAEKRRILIKLVF
ncbi:MAG: hypothetical protein ACLS6G_09185 [Christensenellales bacterium]